MTPATMLRRDEDLGQLEIVWNGDQLEIWVPNASKEQLSRLSSMLSHWGFPPDHRLRPATDKEIEGLKDMMPAIADMMRERGIAVLESPMRIRRERDGVNGQAFDELRIGLGEAGRFVSSAQLRENLQSVRLRNLPPGFGARDYFA